MSRPCPTPNASRLGPLVLAWLGSAPLPALAQAPTLTPPVLLPGDGALAAAVSDQRISDVARGVGHVLAVWQDERTDLVGNLLGDQGARDVWAGRFEEQGQLLDLLPFPVTQGAGDQEGPKVAWNGEAWLVAWTAQVPTASYFTDGIEVARVGADGTLLDPTPLQITTASNTGNMELWGVASDGQGWAVFWKDWGGSSWQIRAARIAADGTLLDPTPLDLGHPSSQPYRGDVAFAVDEYLVVWNEWVTGGKDNIRARRVAPDLTPLGPMFTVASHAYYEIHPAVAMDGFDFFVVWERYDSCCVGGGGKVFGSRVQHDGTVLDGPDGLAIYAPPSLTGTTGREPDVTWNGVDWVATFTKPETGGLRIDAARVTPGGVTLDPDGFDVDPNGPRQEGSAVIGLQSGDSLVLWTDNRAGGVQPNDTHGALVSPSGVPTPIGAQVLAAPAQTSAELVSVPGGALAVWTSRVSGEHRVLAQPLGPNGVALQPEPVEVAVGPDLGNAHGAWNGSVVLVSWDDAAGVHARRLDAGGALLDPASIDVMPGHASDVASLGDTFLVTALHAPSNPEIVNVYSRRVSNDGLVLDGTSVFVGSSFARSQAVVGFDGGWLVAWQRNFSHDDVHSSLHLRFVSAANVPGATLIASSGTPGSAYNQQPTLAVDEGGQALLAWQITQGGDDWNVVARRVLPGPVLLDPTWIQVTTASDRQLLPTAAWDGQEFVLAWQDGRNASYFWDERTDVYAARVGADGSVLDPNGFALASSMLPETWPSVMGLGNGSALFLWSAFHDEAPYTAYRLETAVMDAPCLGTSYCTAAVNSTGSGALVCASGSTSVAANDLVLTAGPVPSNQFGIFYYGPNAIELPFGHGFRCVGGVVCRMPPVSSGQNGSLSFALDNTAPQTQACPIVPGSVWRFQAWYRDPAAGAPGFNLSDAVTVSFGG